MLAAVKRLGTSVFSTMPDEAEFLVDDPADPSRKLIRQVLGAVAEYGGRMTVLRLQAGPPAEA